MTGRGWLGLLAAAAAVASPGPEGEEAGRGEVYSVVELPFEGPPKGPRDAPAREVDFTVLFRHASGAPEHRVHGFWDGGRAFKVRFCPTREGRWSLAEVRSNVPELDRRREGDYVTALASKHPGFWRPDPESPGGRWYRRSDGSHPYIIGNTHYSFLSGFKKGGVPAGNDIAADVAANARHFKKLRFTPFGDRYPHPEEKPFLDDDGRPTDSGDFSHRPNPKWFGERVDLAVRTAWAHDLVADLILCGPDAETSRSTLAARGNGGDPGPWLRYVAARYGSYPNVWFCLANEYDIQKPKYAPEEIARMGRALRGALPYPTPLSVHPASRPLWAAALDDGGAWADHHIIQKKLRAIAPAADVIGETRRGSRVPGRPTCNDELSYQGEGDKHTEEDTIASHLGTFLGGGYGTTGHKPANKEGHYFSGRFDPAEHTAADNLLWLRQAIDAGISFWKMAPDASAFPGLDPAFRAMAWPGREMVLGTDKAGAVTAELPPGSWSVTRHDVVRKESQVLSSDASGRFAFEAPPSRAVLFHFKRMRD
jgi:hypothetical protein